MERATIDRERTYSPAEAVRMLKSADGAKFDETVEVHFNLGLNVRHADEQLRGTLMLPYGTGKEARVAVFAEGEKAKEAEEAGADVVGSADLAKRVEEGFTDFDVAIATPDQMGNVDYVAREVIKAEDTIDYTRRDNVAERLAKKFGAAFADTTVRSMRSTPAVR